MKVNFIGHGLHGFKDTVGDYICSSLRSVNFQKFTSFSAFTKMSAFNIIKEDLITAKRDGKQVKFYLGIVPKGTSKEALQFLIDSEIETYTYCNADFIFHPKIYLFEGNKRTRLIIGSSNLTSQGLFKNVEASLRIDFLNGDVTGKKLKEQFETYFKPILNATDPHTNKLTNDLLDTYIDDNIVVSEDYTIDDNDIAKGNNPFTSRKFKKINKSELGGIEDEKFNKYNSEHRFSITKEYLDTWESYYQIYNQYIIENETVVVKRDTDISGLYRWYRKQKHFFNTGEIPEEHKVKLEKLQFPFTDAHNIEWDKAWEAKYNELVDYYRKNGRAWIKRIKDKNNPLKSLSDWCALQRSYHKHNNLSEDRVQRLNQIKFPWSIPNLGMLPDDESWFEKYLELEEFKKKNGHCHPPQVNPNGTSNRLGRWVNDQMTLKNVGRVRRSTKERVFLNPIREEYLTELGVDWNYELSKHKKSFNEKVNKFINFRNQHPDLKPPKGKYKKERDWLAQMRYKFDTLPDWKKKILVEEKIINPNE